MAYADPFDTATPLGTEGLANGDDRIRELKRALDQRLGGFFSGWPNTDPLTVSGAKVSGTVPNATTAGSATSAGSVPAAGITGSIGDAQIAALSASKLTGALPAISGAALTSLAGANVTGTVPAATTAAACSGNAATATKLQTARNINGVAFDGSANITISAAADAGLLTGATLASNVLNSSLTTVGVLAAPHMTSPVVDSGGMIVTGAVLATAQGMFGAFNGAGDAGSLIVTNATATTASAGAQTLPAAPAGFLVWLKGATTMKVPYYNN